MPLDRVNGEVIEGLPVSAHVVIEPRHLFEHDIIVEYEAPAKFRSASKPVMARRHIYEDVMAEARAVFAGKGALIPIVISPDDILVQVYPAERKVTVLVNRQVAGKEWIALLEYPRQGQWPAALIRSLLEAAGKKAPLRH